MGKSSLAAKADNDGVIEAPPVSFRTAYGVRFHVSLECDPEEDRTQQAWKDDCDINIIMSRYLKTGVLPPSSAEPVYLDATAYDFQKASDLVARARGEFSLLSAVERDEFGNSVELWLETKALEAQEAEEAAEATRQAELAAAKAAAPDAAKAAVAAPGAPAGAKA